MKKGERVTYTVTGERGIIKSAGVSRKGKATYHVVFNCNNDWNNYEHYTAFMIYAEDLTKGWN